jgi:hypothetical protein
MTKRNKEKHTNKYKQIRGIEFYAVKWKFF